MIAGSSHLPLSPRLTIVAFCYKSNNNNILRIKENVYGLDSRKLVFYFVFHLIHLDAFFGAWV
jgi:hypothetical protein